MIFGGAPRFWWGEPGWQERLLAPASALYGRVAGQRLAAGDGAEAGVPVLCVGNFTVGGGGKTPTALALAQQAKEAGLKPGFLSRGHGGRLREATLVEPGRHDAKAVGDEALLLAERAPTVIGRDRAAGAACLVEKTGCDLVIMDDGFQSARLAYDFALLVVDGARGLGNGAVLPGGPLRAPLDGQLRRADAVLVIGEGAAGDAAALIANRAGRPVHRARLSPRNGEEMQGRPLMAFAGIADPHKFYRSLRALGGRLDATRDFPDHHPFTDRELDRLMAEASAAGLTLATTTKDAARLRAGPKGRRLLQSALVLDVELALDPADAAGFIDATLKAFRQRRA